MHTGIWWGDLRKGACKGDLDLDEKIILKWVLKTEVDFVCSIPCIKASFMKGNRQMRL